MYRIRRFGIIKTSTIVAVMYMLIIVIFFVPFAILTLALSPANAGAGAVSVLLLGLLAAILYGAIGWIFTAIACALYNLAAGNFYRSTEKVARQRAGTRTTGAVPSEQGDGARAYDPAAAAAAVPTATDPDPADPFSTW